MIGPFYQLFGESVTATDLAKIAGTSRGNIVSRLAVGMSPIDTIRSQIKPRNEDLTGRTYGYLNVLSYDGRGPCNKRMFECLCKCGQRTIVDGAKLKSGKTYSCGCYSKELASQRCQKGLLKKLQEDLTGETFGYLHVISQNGKVQKNSKSARAWLCRCICGNTAICTTRELRSKSRTHCGCKKAENYSAAVIARAPRYDVYGEAITMKEISELSDTGPATIAYRVKRRGMSLEQAAFDSERKRA